MNPWLVAVVVLAAALVGLGAWVVIDQTRSSSATQDLASPEVTAMLNARVAAINRFDAAAIAAFYTQDAVMEEIEAGVPRVVSRGHDQILDRLRFLVDGARSSDLQLRTGTTTQIGPYVTQTNSFGSFGATEGDGQGILVFRLDESGKIAHEWAIVGAP